MRDTTRPVFLVVLAFATGCGDAPQSEPEPAPLVTSGGETSSPDVYGVRFTAVTEATPTCFYFSGPGELGRDDRLGGSAILDETSLAFSSGPVFVRDPSGALVRASSHEYDGLWTVHETITLTPSSEDGFIGEYHYEEFEPGATTPGQCRLHARIALGAPGSELLVGTAQSRDACERAAACCYAFVDGMPGMELDREQICAGVRAAGARGEAGASACESAMGAWAEALTAMGRPVPAACE